MIEKFVNLWEARKKEVEIQFQTKHPDNYEEIVKTVVSILRDEEQCEPFPDPERIHSIDDGDWQGTLLFVIGSDGYQPSDYWFVKVDYGSCSGCDTLKGIRQYNDDPPSEAQVKDYMTLALHILQGLTPTQ